MKQKNTTEYADVKTLYQYKLEVIPGTEKYENYFLHIYLHFELVTPKIRDIHREGEVRHCTTTRYQ